MSYPNTTSVLALSRELLDTLTEKQRAQVRHGGEYVNSVVLHRTYPRHGEGNGKKPHKINDNAGSRAEKKKGQGDLTLAEFPVTKTRAGWDGPL